MERKNCWVCEVSILVVLEVVLKAVNVMIPAAADAGFNPCCSGSGTERHQVHRCDHISLVSILVVLEVVLKVTPRR